MGPPSAWMATGTPQGYCHCGQRPGHKPARLPTSGGRGIPLAMPSERGRGRPQHQQVRTRPRGTESGSGGRLRSLRPRGPMARHDDGGNTGVSARRTTGAARKEILRIAQSKTGQIPLLTVRARAGVGTCRHADEEVLRNCNGTMIFGVSLSSSHRRRCPNDLASLN